MTLDLDLRQTFTHQFLSVVFACPSNSLSIFTSQKNYIQLFTVIYILSNKLKLDSSRHDELFGNLNSIFAAVPVKFLESLLHRRLASIRAAFEALLDLAGAHKQRDAFQFLLKVGATYGWLAISAKGHLLLFYATSMNLVSAVRTLLDYGCRPDSKYPQCHVSHDNEIVTALIYGRLRCAQLLLERCDVNKEIEHHSRFPATNFEHFLYRLDAIGEFSESGLKLFIQAGADLNKPIIYFPARTRPIWYLKLSTVEYLFYFHRPLLDSLPSSSIRVQNGHLSRIGVLLSLNGGTQSLEAYLGSLAPRPHQQQLAELFRRLIVDQFGILGSNHGRPHTDLKTVRTMVGFGMRFGAGINEVICQVPEILHEFLKWVRYDCDKSQLEAALYLLENGATVTGRVLSWMTELPDTRFLDLALGSIKDPKGLEYVVVRAAARHNFEAVERLLHAGAKLDTDMPFRDWAHRRKNVSIIIKIISYHTGRGLSQMLDFLIMKGAPLRLSKRKPHLHDLLQFILTWTATQWREDCIEIVQYVVSAGCALQHSPFPTAPLLEACRTTEVFEYLYRNGAQLRPGSPLTVWIALGGGIELCQEMLKAGADPNAYSRGWLMHRWHYGLTPLQAAAFHCREDVVEVLLRAGSDVNATAECKEGFSALQSSCVSQPESLEDQQRKLRTVCLLLAHGADVNAAPARVKGRTALQGAAASGDLAVAKLLLFHEPMADVNAPPCEYCLGRSLGTLERNDFGTALDCAAVGGRIDMVQLLLNCNALSHDRGKTGYDGAIEQARVKGHLAVADLICQHAKDAQRSGTSPDLSQPQRHWCEYGYDSGPDEASECSEDDEEPILSSDTNVLDEEQWDSQPVEFVSSDIYQGDLSTATHDSNAYSLTDMLPYGDSTMVTATDADPWLVQWAFDLPQAEDLTQLWPFQSSLQDSEVGFGNGTSQDVGVLHADPHGLENEGFGDPDYIGLPERDFYEVSDDD